MKKFGLVSGVLLLVFTSAYSQKLTLLKPDRVFDGQNMHENWWVLIKDNHIEAVGESGNFKVLPNAEVLDLKGMTLMPGMIEGHSHLLK